MEIIRQQLYEECNINTANGIFDNQKNRIIGVQFNSQKKIGQK